MESVQSNPNIEDYFTAKSLFESAIIWFSRNYYWSFVVVMLYLTSVKISLSFMRNREAFNLRKILTIWNVALAVFSLGGAYGTLPEMFHVLRKHGFHHSVCVNSYVQQDDLFYWYVAFVVSKVVELLDTLFLVVRKRRLVFLHWFHHAWTIFACWVVCGEAPGMARWTLSMNYSIHTVMYGYFALKSMGFDVPKVVAIAITSGQIAQMVAALVCSLYAAAVLFSSGQCDMTFFALAFYLFTYGFMFFLFVNFFVRAYVYNAKRDWVKSK